MKVLFLVPGDINLPTGGYRYDKHMLTNWQKAGRDVTLVCVEGNYPFPSKLEIADAVASVEKLPDADIAVVDGLLGGANPQLMEALGQKMKVVALIHHPLCLENGLERQEARMLEEREGEGLKHVSHVIAVSPATRNAVCDLFGFDDGRIDIVLPGVERGKASRGSDDATLNLLCVGSVIERKGHRFLIEALAGLKAFQWRLDCMGSTAFDEALFETLQNMLVAHNLEDRIVFHGAVCEETIEAAYQKADVFVLPSLYEGYGMVYAEAIVRGIPVIGTTAGAIAQTVPDGCGILVEPENTEALGEALETMISNSELRQKFRAQTLLAEASFPTWESAASRFYEILEETL